MENVVQPGIQRFVSKATGSNHKISLSVFETAGEVVTTRLQPTGAEKFQANLQTVPAGFPFYLWADVQKA
jgi:hypothetical protein